MEKQTNHAAFSTLISNLQQQEFSRNMMWL